MMRSATRRMPYLLLISSLVLLSACAAGNAQFSSEAPAGFWYGVWHGVISFISLLIHIFNADVLVYEVNNTGGWYDFGFLLGAVSIWGSGSHARYRSAEKKRRDQEWQEIGGKVEEKIMRRMKEWAEDESGTGLDEDWEEIGDKVEKKLKRKLREWAEKE